MAFNLFVAYDLINPGQNYDAVQDRIKDLGPWYKVQYSLYYVNTVYTPQQAHALVWEAMDPNDRLLVGHTYGAVVSHDIPPSDVAAINKVWFGGPKALPGYPTRTNRLVSYNTCS